MYFAPFVLLSFASIAVQAASTPEIRGLSIPLTRNTNRRTSEGVVQVESLRRHVHHAIRKFSGVAGVDGISSFPPGKRGHRVASEPLTFPNDVYGWTCELKIGATKFNLILDTGSTDLLVPRTDCAPCGKVTHFYDPKQSGGKDLHRKINENYGSGNATGELYQDTVSIAGLTAKRQTFVAATAYSGGLDFSPNFDGIFGLAYPRLSPIKATPLFQTLVEQKKIADAVFGVSLDPNCSEFYLGGINPKYSDKDFAYSNVLGKEHNVGYWTVSTTAVSIGGVGAIGPKSAVVDTGTSFVLVGDRTARGFYKHIANSSYHGDGLYTIPCHFNKNVTVTFSGNKHGFTIPPRDFILNALDASPNVRCYGAIVGGGATLSEDVMVVGDVFLRQVYTKFDFEKNQVGFAALRRC